MSKQRYFAQGTAMKNLGKLAGAMCLSLAALFGTSGSSEAATYYFGVITDPNSSAYTVENVDIAQAAFSVTTSAGPLANETLFRFEKIDTSGNDINHDAVLAQLYFDVVAPVPPEINPIVASNFSIYADSDGLNNYTNIGGGGPKSGVEFTTNTGNLPGGNQPTVGFSADYGADALPPPASLGLDQFGEWVDIKYTGLGLGDIDALMQGDNPLLAVGIHIQSIGDDGVSLSSINIPTPNQLPPPAIPLPASLILLLSALGGLGFLGRYRAKA